MGPAAALTATCHGSAIAAAASRSPARKSLVNSPEPDQPAEEYRRTGSGNPSATSAPKCPSS